MKNKLKVDFYFFILSLFLVVNLPAQKMQSDNGDGTYTNPVIYSDFPDPDVIKINSTFYGKEKGY
jgi:beta-xylosidase